MGDEAAAENSTPNIWQELEKWAQGFKGWQKLVLRYAVLHGLLTEAQINEVHAVFLHENGLGDDPKIDLKGTITGRPAAGALSPVRLTKIDNLRDVNALPPSAALIFSPGLTIIYGGNGTGKSGFARILSNVCFSRMQHTILPNVYEAPEGTSANADITIIDGTQAETVIPLEQAKTHADLKRLAVFDTSVAQTLIANQNTFGFKPAGFDIFPEMARVYGELAHRLTEQIEALTCENTFTKSFVAPESPVSTFVEGLGADTDLTKLRQISAFGDMEKARLEEIQRQILELQSKSLAAAMAQIKEAKGDILALEQRLKEILALLGEEQRKVYRVQLCDAAAKAEQAAKQGAESFKRAFFKSIGSPQWKEFLTAARTLAQIEGATYPQGDDHCLLCHRPLEADSVSLLHRFWTFLESPALRAAESARQVVDKSAKMLDGLQLAIFSADTRVRTHVQRLDPILARQIDELIADLNKDRASIVAALRAGTGEIKAAALSDVSDGLGKLNNLIDEDIARLSKGDVAVALASLESQRIELRHRQVLSQLMPNIEQFVADAKWVKNAAALKRSLNPRHLTEKESELFRTVVAKNYKDRLAEECKTFNCNLPVEVRARGERGQTVRSLTLKGGHNPSEILSEGEQRAVALADFLTEVGLNPANAGIVLDDPVTSQDHRRKELIAQRLVRESKTRQVIIFTHDAVFLTMLATTCEKTKTEMMTHWVECDGDGRPGQISLNDCPAGIPHYRTTQKAKNTLKEAKAAAGSKRLDLIQRGMGELRRTIEEIVPYLLFKEVMTRWSDQIRVTSLKKINWDNGLVDELIEAFEAASAKMQGHSHTEESAGAPPEPKNLEEMIERVDNLIRRVKPDRKR
jgi:energy-coupling factor transporter ATP-binding protein EcfA2